MTNCGSPVLGTLPSFYPQLGVLVSAGKTCFSTFYAVMPPGRLRGERSAMVVPTATVLVYNPRQSPYDCTTGNIGTCLVRPACL
jgi:hypothetical protein